MKKQGGYLSELLLECPIKYELVGSDIFIKDIAMPERATENTLIWIDKHRNVRNVLKITSAKAIVCTRVELNEAFSALTFVFCDDPRLIFAHIGNRLILKETPSLGVHPTAIIDSDAKIHPKAYVGPYSRVGKAELGSGTRLLSHVVVQNNTVIGRDVLIREGAVIGADGMGHVPLPDGSLIPFPHVGSVIIGDNVEIGVNSSIARGALGETIINNGAIIDCQVQIGHNATVGKNTRITAGVVVGGSAKIGDSAFIGINATIKDGVKVGNKACIGASAIAIFDVADGAVLAARPSLNLPSYTKE